jgi:Rrf2 family cysteine metabolism transcriptional repressor
MFGLSKKADYGLELMIVLAKNYGQGPLSLQQIAKLKKLPFKFLEQVVTPLREAGLIKAQKGRAGGYLLKKKPGKISVAQIVEVLAGPVQLGACLGCPKAQVCGQKEVWTEVGDKVKKTIEEKTLADLVE